MITTEDYRLTFGIEYRDRKHPSGCPADPSGYVTITAIDEPDARKAALDVYGREWCSLYPADRAPDRDRDYYPRGQVARFTTPRAQLILLGDPRAER